MRTALPILVLCLFAIPTASAQSDKDKKPQPKKAGNEVEVRFTDGSTVRMLMLQDSVDIDTKYGKLKVPASEIRAIELGIHMPPGVEKRINDAIAKLGSTNFKERDAALNELVELGVHSYRSILAATKTSDLEVGQRLQMAIKRINEKVHKDLLRVNPNDRLLTTDFPISGRIITPTLKAKTPFFGELDLKLSELCSISWTGSNIDSEVIVDAKYAQNNQWLDTGVTLDGTSGLTITASGDIDLLNDGSGEFISGPAGTRNIGGRRPGNKLPGTLMGRIGESGTPFVVGDRYQTNLALAGKLYFNVVPAPFNNGQAPSGNYKAVVRAGYFLDGR